MRFAEALKEMKKGHKITRPSWGGYWYWDPDKGTILIHCKDGTVLDIFDTASKEFTLDNMSADDFCIYRQKEKLRVFISQLMRGRSDKDILDERERITETLKSIYTDYEVEIIDSFFKGDTTHGLSPLECLGESIKLLGTADLVYFADKWDEGRGCIVEYCVANLYDIPSITEENLF